MSWQDVPTDTELERLHAQARANLEATFEERTGAPLASFHHHVLYQSSLFGFGLGPQVSEPGLQAIASITGAPRLMTFGEPVPINSLRLESLRRAKRA